LKDSPECLSLQKVIEKHEQELSLKRKGANNLWGDSQDISVSYSLFSPCFASEIDAPREPVATVASESDIKGA